MDRMFGEVSSDSLGTAILECDDERFPNVFRLIKIGCTIPITSCTCERSSSTLRRLRNWMRSSMSCSRLSSLALMNIHYNCKWPNHSSKIIEISTKYRPHAYKNKSLYTNNGIIVMF